MTTSSVTAETRWETYTEAAARLGITAEAVRAHAKRQRWPRQRPNRDPNGPVLVAIPPDFRPARTRPPVDPGQSGGQPGLVEALRLALEQAEQRVVMAEGHSLAAEDRVHRAEARADRAEQAATAAHERADALQTRLERLGAELMT